MSHEAVFRKGVPGQAVEALDRRVLRSCCKCRVTSAARGGPARRCRGSHDLPSEANHRDLGFAE